jgi:hypothetical protein
MSRRFVDSRPPARLNPGDLTSINKSSLFSRGMNAMGFKDEHQGEGGTLVSVDAYITITQS